MSLVLYTVWLDGNSNQRFKNLDIEIRTSSLAGYTSPPSWNIMLWLVWEMEPSFDQRSGVGIRSAREQ